MKTKVRQYAKAEGTEQAPKKAASAKVRYEYQKTEDKLLVAECNEYKGRKQFQVMEQWKDQDGNWRFGAKVVTFNSANVESFLDFIAKNAAKIKSELAPVKG